MISSTNHSSATHCPVGRILGDLVLHTSLGCATEDGAAKQRLLENFVLSSRIDPPDRPIRLTSHDVSCKAPSFGGLGIHLIAAFVRRQRISLLQQYAVEMMRSSDLTWATPAAAIFVRALLYDLPNQPLDLLSMSYYRHRGQISLVSLPKWWEST